MQEVRCRYHGKNRSIGTFDTRDKAALANEIAQGMLLKTKDSNLTDDKIKRNMSLAKEAASCIGDPTNADVSIEEVLPNKANGHECGQKLQQNTNLVKESRLQTGYGINEGNCPETSKCAAPLSNSSFVEQHKNGVRLRSSGKWVRSRHDNNSSSASMWY